MEEVSKGMVYWMKIFKRGPRKDQLEGVRPCVVIQNNELNKSLSSVLVIPFSDRKDLTNESTTVVIPNGSVQYTNGHSPIFYKYAHCEKILYLEKEYIVEEIGKVSDNLMQKIVDTYKIII